MALHNQLSERAAARYREASGRQYHEGKRGLKPEALPWVMSLRAAKFQARVRDSDTVFEFGVGAGWNLGRLRCARKVGCDVAEFLANDLRAMGIEFLPNAEAAPAGLADAVICHHALEHVIEPAATLAELLRILKPGGTLVLHVPWEREGRYARYDPGEPNHHLYTWNAQTLGNLAAVVGFRLTSVGVRRYGYDRFAASQAVRLRLRESGFRLFRACLITLRPLWEVELVAGRPEE
jgi:SAM-dependent methyltransferase